jgi:hypothetical protein
MVVKNAVLLLMIVISIPLVGQPQRQIRYELVTEQVAGAVQRQLLRGGIKISEEEISLPGRVVATEPFPTLEVNSVEAFSSYASANRSIARSKIKLSCRTTSVCLPFYAIVSWTGRRNDVSDEELRALFSSRRESLAPTTEVTMSAGAHATLVMDDECVHIRLKVVSLESGPVGRIIRVASPDHQRIYVAEIVSANLLKGRF